MSFDWQTFDWQTVAVALIVTGALGYVARRALARLRSFRVNKGGGGSCETGCGKCGDVDAPAGETRPLVRLGGSKAAGRVRD